MTKKQIIIAGTLAVIISLGLLGFVVMPVRTEEKAIEIAKAYVAVKFSGESFDDCIIKAYDEGDIWIVYYSIPPRRDDTGKVIGVTLGGGPEVHIKKLTCRVIYCMIQL